MEECPICYIEIPENAFKILECKHSLCNLCFSKLRSRVCPFCRYPIKNKIKKKKRNRRLIPTTILVEEIIPPLNQRINRRQRRRVSRHNNTIIAPSIYLTNQEIDFIINEEEEPLLNNTLESVNDRKKQLYRKNRNRWKQNYIRTNGRS